MKIALCLSGYYKSKSGLAASQNGSKYIKDNILDKYNVDVFVHSWDLENQDLIEDTYSPKKSLFESQKDFREELSLIDEEWFRADLVQKNLWRTAFSSLSMNYSRMRSLQLKKLFEEENSFQYDCVVLARFDLGNRGLEHPQPTYVTKINFQPHLDMNFIYTAFWYQLNCGFAEHWIYSSSENMDKVGELYNSLVDYYQKDSSYIKAMISGWPYSNIFNEFSNEIFKPKQERTKNLYKYPRWECINNHAVYKWYFLETDLMKKCKFLKVIE
jgi:hypothetical protein